MNKFIIYTIRLLLLRNNLNLSEEDLNEWFPVKVKKDRERLAQYMIDYNLGVSVQNTYEIKKIDSDYFEEG